MPVNWAAKIRRAAVTEEETVTIHVLIADEQSIIRRPAAILNAQLGIGVVGQAADGCEAVALAPRPRPDVCLLGGLAPLIGTPYFVWLWRSRAAGPA